MRQIWAHYHKLCHENGHILVVWIETYKCLWLIELFVKDCFEKFVRTQVYYFSKQIVHIKGLHVEGFLFFDVFFIFFEFFQKKSQNGEHGYSFKDVEFFKTINISVK